MSSSVLYMSMSLDGLITGPDDKAGQGLGAGGERLHEWLRERADTSPPTADPEGESVTVFDEQLATGAVVVGRRTFDLAGQLLIAAGANAKAITTYVGHSSIQVTFDRYGHLMPGSEAAVAELLDTYLAATASPPVSPRVAESTD